MPAPRTNRRCPFHPPLTTTPLFVLTVTSPRLKHTSTVGFEDTVMPKGPSCNVGEHNSTSPFWASAQDHMPG